MLAVTISVENLAGGMGTAAFVAYLSSLCNLSYTATQYALLSSFMAQARTTLSAGGGFLAASMDWVGFFLTTTAAADTRTSAAALAATPPSTSVGRHGQAGRGDCRRRTGMSEGILRMIDVKRRPAQRHWRSASSCSRLHRLGRSRTGWLSRTGGVTGIYYQIGAAICRLLRDHPPAHAIDCRTEGSAGSIANLLSLGQDEVPLALAQADSLHDAVTGTGGFANRPPDTRLRALFSPVVETFLVLSRAGDSATQIADLKGHRVNIGPPASGTEVTFRQLMAARGWSDTDFTALLGIRSSQQAAALCGGRVDAIAFVAANPVPVVQEATFVAPPGSCRSTKSSPT